MTSLTIRSLEREREKRNNFLKRRRFTVKETFKIEKSDANTRESRARWQVGNYLLVKLIVIRGVQEIKVIVVVHLD